MSTQEEYRRVGARLDAHVEGCEFCSSGVACPEGDSVAEKEFRTWRAWQRGDEPATRAHARAGFPW